MDPLILSHGIPLRSTALIPPYIVYLSQDIDHNICNDQGDKCSIPTFIAGCIICSVNVGGNDSRCLNEHVVQCCGDGARADGVGVARVPCYLDGMRWGVLVLGTTAREENVPEG